ncbi:MAG: ATPase, T2SS/T4P/T4SS family [Candidatus Omnitrophota bacterium]
MGNNLGNILLKSGKIQPDELKEALREQDKSGEPLGEIVIKLGFLSSKEISLALSQQLNIPYIELGEDFILEHEYVRLIPEYLARKYCLIPYKKEDNAITVVMADPLDIEAVDAVKTLSGLRVNKAIGVKNNILFIIDKFYQENVHIERNIQDIVDFEKSKIDDITQREHVNAEQLKILANDAPVVKIVNLLLMQAVRDRASDIHFEPGEKAISVRLRIDGLLRNVTPPPKNLYQAVVTRIKILSNMDIAERRLPQDGRFQFTFGDRVIDIRVSSLPEACGEKIVLRILDRGVLLINMEEIGFNPIVLKRFQGILRSPHGIILITGPTGSGKTTTLYSALNFLKTPEKNIQTVEDPVEYLIEGINQMQVKPQIGLVFAKALRSILRQDPDIIMIGEIRDSDTASIAIRAALTGHLVLSTLHTNDAPSAFSRLKNIGIEPYLMANAINLIVSQRLIRVICNKCRQEIKPSSTNLKIIKNFYPDADTWKYYIGKGCRECFYTGFKGRLGIFEFLEVTEDIKSIILENLNTDSINNKAIEDGMATLLVDGFEKVKKGITTIEEVLNVCPIPKGC